MAREYPTLLDLVGHTPIVRLDRIEYPNPFGGVARWNVVVALPQDMAAAEKFIEDKVPALRAAVGEHMVVTEVLPQRLNITGVGELPCVFINGFREEE